MNFTPEQQEVLLVLDAMKTFITTRSGSKFGVEMVSRQYTELRDALALQISRDIISNHKMFRGNK